MKRLAEAKLFVTDLLTIDSPEIVRRYNQCLEQLGIAASALDSFQIDGMGWSPEIAEEKQDNFYLSAGMANPMAVIVSPEQRRLRVHFPFNSYDERMLSAYFARYENEIVDITTTDCLGLHIDPELTAYQNPRDLLLLDYIIVRTTIGPLEVKASAQRALVDEFLGSDLGWFDEDLRRSIIASARQSGDMRYRRLSVPDFKFTEIGSFYTRAFGGVFVFRGLSHDRWLMILEDPEQRPQSVLNLNQMLTLHDQPLLEVLFEERLVDIDLKSYAARPAALKYKRDCVLADLICALDGDVDVAALNSAQKSRFAAAHPDKLPASVLELEKLMKNLARGNYPRVDRLSSDLRWLLVHPHNRLPQAEQEVVWQLICRLQDWDVQALFRHDKNLFLERYRHWPECKKQWTVTTLRNEMEE